MSLVKEELAAMLVSSPPPLSPALGQECVGNVWAQQGLSWGWGSLRDHRGFPRDGIPSWG